MPNRRVEDSFVNPFGFRVFKLVGEPNWFCQKCEQDLDAAGCLTHVCRESKEPTGIAECLGAAIFGMPPSEAIQKGICISCKDPVDHKNVRCPAEAAEYSKTGLCGPCFDRITLGV